MYATSFFHSAAALLCHLTPSNFPSETSSTLRSGANLHCAHFLHISSTSNSDSSTSTVTDMDSIQIRSTLKQMSTEQKQQHIQQLFELASHTFQLDEKLLERRTSNDEEVKEDDDSEFM